MRYYYATPGSSELLVLSIYHTLRSLGIAGLFATLGHLVHLGLGCAEPTHHTSRSLLPYYSSCTEVVDSHHHTPYLQISSCRRWIHHQIKKHAFFQSYCLTTPTPPRAEGQETEHKIPSVSHTNGYYCMLWQ